MPDPPQQSAQTTDARARLRQHFQSIPSSSHGQRWDELWQAGDFLPWDRRGPNPALVDTLNDRLPELGGSPLAFPVGDESRGVISQGDARVDVGAARRKRALVPGCGKGYDVLVLAAHGFDAVGLEISPGALKACEQMAEEVETRRRNGEDVGDYEIKDKAIGKGQMKFVAGDFFLDDWVDEAIPKEENETDTRFDLIYDYTFFCALPPELRPAWALRTSKLLAPNGRLICVEFPTYKEPSTGGPPWGAAPAAYVMHLSKPGEAIPYDDKGFVVAKDPLPTHELSLKRIAHWQPARTHEIGKGTDWVSIWQH